MVATMSPAPAELIAGYDGNLYGTTVSGGAFGKGSVFRLRLDGTLTTLASFDGTIGRAPFNLVYATDGNLYGAMDGGVFKLTPTGALTRLTSYAGRNFAEGSNGKLIGAQTRCGDEYCYSREGYLFEITRAGVVTEGGTFDARSGFPNAPLTSAPGGTLYGVSAGAAPDYDPRLQTATGEIYCLGPDGTGCGRMSFDTWDGSSTPLLYAFDGTLFGFTDGYFGISPTSGEPMYGQAKFFRYKPPANPNLDSGKLTVIGEFGGRKLAQAADGTIYGIGTSTSGSTIYRLKRPTTLTGHGIYSIDPLTGKITLQPSATLTDDMTTRGVPGQTVSFSRQGQLLCVAQTDAGGTAKCTIPVKQHLGGFDATFAETATYAATSVHSPILCVGSVCP